MSGSGSSIRKRKSNCCALARPSAPAVKSMVAPAVAYAVSASMAHTQGAPSRECVKMSTSLNLLLQIAERHAPIRCIDVVNHHCATSVRSRKKQSMRSCQTGPHEKDPERAGGAYVLPCDVLVRMHRAQGCVAKDAGEGLWVAYVHQRRSRGPG